MADEFWGSGKIVTGKSIQEIFELGKVSTDCITDNPNTLYVHRKLADGTDIYFLSNQVDEPITFNATFRVDGKYPELWNAVDGTVRNLPDFDLKDGLTTVPLKLDAWGSAFIVFRKVLEVNDGYTVRRPFYNLEDALKINFPEPKIVATVEGPWTVRFESDDVHRGPKEPQTFEKLIDWTASENDAIKYYSGKAVYETNFTLNAVEDKKLFVHLGNVQVLATVTVNGHEAGKLWTAPWEVDVTKFVRSGENMLRVEVTNLWVNRLVGDAKLPESERKTWITVNPHNADSPLKPSGLLGPVTIIAR